MGTGKLGQEIARLADRFRGSQYDRSLILVVNNKILRFDHSLALVDIE